VDKRNPVEIKGTYLTRKGVAFILLKRKYSFDLLLRNADNWMEGMQYYGNVVLTPLKSLEYFEIAQNGLNSVKTIIKSFIL
jgi:hypothetical protein